MHSHSYSNRSTQFGQPHSAGGGGGSAPSHWPHPRAHIPDPTSHIHVQCLKCSSLNNILFWRRALAASVLGKAVTFLFPSLVGWLVGQFWVEAVHAALIKMLPLPVERVWVWVWTRVDFWDITDRDGDREGEGDGDGVDAFAL